MTLIEGILLFGIVVGIGILAFRRVRESVIHRNEEAAVRAMKAVVANEYAWGLPSWDRRVPRSDARPFPATLADLARHGLDPDIEAGQKAGYSFALEIVGKGYRLRARPVIPGFTGRRFFFLRYDEAVVRVGTATAVVRSRLGAPASSADSPIE